MTKEVLVKIPLREERVFLALLLKGLAVLLMACVGLSAFAVTEEDIVIDLSGEPASLDPHVQWNPSSYYVYRNIFDNLFTRDNEGKIVGQVAETWEQTTDTTLKLTIREGIFFHDEEPLKPSDVVFSIKRIIDPEFGSPQLGQFNKIVDAVAEENTVIIFTADPYPSLLAQLVKLSIVPEHIISKVGDSKFNDAPIGSGPYAFLEWDRGNMVKLIRNEDYWGDVGPFLRATFRSVPDVATRVADLRAGTADLVVSIDADFAQEINSGGTGKILSALSERVGYLGLNLEKPPFNNLEMRRAASMAIDRQGIIEGLLQAGEVPIAQMLTPLHFGFDATVPPFEFDVARARAIVSANQALASSPATLATSPVFDQRIVQAIQQMLNDVGFNIAISMSDMPRYLEIVTSPSNRNSELSFGRWSCACQDADGVVYPLLHSSSNWSRVKSTHLDDLLEAARSSLDPVVRQEAYDQVHQIVREEYLMLPLYQATVLYGAAVDLNFVPTANESMFLNRMRIAR